MGSLCAINTRRYHGLFVPATVPPLGRVVALHSVFDRIECAGRTTHLASQQFGDDRCVHPNGIKWITSTDVEPPGRITWRLAAGGLSVTRVLEIDQLANQGTIRWTITGQQATACTLAVRPMTPLRSFHDLSHHHADAGPQVRWDHHAVQLAAHSGTILTLSTPSGTWHQDEQWWHDLAYEHDRLRGQDWREAIFSPGEVRWEASSHPLPMSCELRFTITTPALDRSKLLMPRPSQQDSEASGEVAHDPRWDRLAIAADQFVVAHRDGGVTILAGYPWFSDWGRDSMICLPGLLHARGRFDAAEQLLLNFAGQMRRGLIPNCFDDGSTTPQYNTADASLWFVHAVWLMRERLTHDARAQLVAACGKIIEAYTHGTDFGIACDHADGLIALEDDGVHALTWMDAVRDGQRFTPRCGKPVEINALWHHALRCLADLAEDAQLQADLLARADRVRESFQQFWRDERSALHDTLQPGERPEVWRGDEVVRPNQLFAVSLGDDLLPADQQRVVVRIVRETLLTPVGVRTLSPSDAAYKPRYEGDMFARDGAYHQGTVWPWLLGPYCEALLRAHDHSADALAEVHEIALRMLDELDNGCVGQLAEVYDGDEPHRPDGCPAQAWSVAELVRIGKMLREMSDRRVRITFC